MEVRQREYLVGPKCFFRAEARPIWTEFAEQPYFEEERSFIRWQNAVQATIDTVKGTVKFGPTGHIIMHPHGCGLGSYLMNRVIRWLKGNFADFQVLHGDLAAWDAKDETNRKRRNRFYESHNFDFDWIEEGISGYFFKSRAGDLMESDVSKISEFSIDDLAKNYCKSAREANKLSNSLTASKRHRVELENYVAKRNNYLTIMCIISFLLIVFPDLTRKIHDLALALVNMQNV